MRRLFTLLITSLVVTAACSDAQTAPSPLPSDLVAAPTRVSLAGKSLLLDASLWRDFMPIAPPDGHPLMGVLRVQTDDGTGVPATVTVDMAWVLNGADVWRAVPREERARAATAPAYEVVLRDGPKWAPGVHVDVVVRLRDPNGRETLLRAANRPIEATH